MNTPDNNDRRSNFEADSNATMLPSMGSASEATHKFVEKMVSDQCETESTNKFHDLIVIHHRVLAEHRVRAGIRAYEDVQELNGEKGRSSKRLTFFRLSGFMTILLLVGLWTVKQHQPEGYSNIATPKPMVAMAQPGKVLEESRSTLVARPKPAMTLVSQPQHVSLEAAANEPFNPLPFSSIQTNFTEGGAQFKWQDSEQMPVTYLVETSNDGVNFEVLNVIDSEPSKKTNFYVCSSKNIGQYFRMVKIVHGGNTYHTKIVNREDESSVASVLEFNDTILLEDARPS